MLEIGRVVNARCQHGKAWFIPAGRRRHAGQRLAQDFRIVVDRRHPVAGEQFGKDVHHRFPVFQHVGDAGGSPEIVLKHVELVLADPHDVDADDMAVDVFRRCKADHGGQEGLVAVDQIGRHAAGANNLLAVIDVEKKGVERPHALLDAAFKLPPFRCRYDARHQVEGDQPL